MQVLSGYYGKLEQKAGRVLKAALFSAFSDEELTKESSHLRTRAGNGENLDDLLPQAYALASEVVYRTLKLHFYYQQILAAIALHEGTIVEMQNGEGKTLVAPFPAYLNSLSGQRVYIATDNDYLAKRDALWMGPIYAMLGISVGVVTPGNKAYRLEEDETEQVVSERKKYMLLPCERGSAYACDVVYGTHIDFIFDYLHDNRARQLQDILLGRQLDFMILDEADRVLIDLARQSVIVSENKKENMAFYEQIFAVAEQLQSHVDYILPTIELTEEGRTHAEAILRNIGLIKDNSYLYDVLNAGVAWQLYQSLLAIHQYKRDNHYVVLYGEIIPVDRDTGRLLQGSFMSNGIHQAIQVKEGVIVTPETVPLAQITYQHFFKLYNKIAGMTATARERKSELNNIYGKRVVVIPPRKNSQRISYRDLIYRTAAARLHNVVAEINEMNELGRPVLINTQSIEKAEELAALVRAQGIACEVLHAKYYEREAAIIELAGKKGAVTISAMMAGRGTDIHISDEVDTLGGLHVIGVEKNSSRYMDRQLVGRSGRQGKAGSSRFFLSLEDDLMCRLNVNVNSVARVMKGIGMDEDTPLEPDPLINRLLEQARERIEGYEVLQRQQLYRLDAILDQHRRIIYAFRARLVQQEDCSAEFRGMMRNIVQRSIECYLPGEHSRKQWNIEGMAQFFATISPSDFPENSFSDLEHFKRQEIEDWLYRNVANAYDRVKKTVFMAENTDTSFMKGEREALMTFIDRGWKHHLQRLNTIQDEMQLYTLAADMDLNWYAQESYKVFWEMLEQIEVDFLKGAFTVGFLVGGPIHDVA